MCLPRPCRGCPRTCRSAPHDRSDPPRRRWIAWRSSTPTPVPRWWRRSTATLTTREPPSLETRAPVPLSAAARRPSRCRTHAAQPPARLRPAAAPRRLRDDDHTPGAPSAAICWSSSTPLVAEYGARIEVAVSDQEIPYPYVLERADELAGAGVTVGRSRPPFPDAAALRGGRRDRRWPVGASRGPATPAVAVRRRPRRLLAAPPRALHGQRLAQRAAMDPAHQLPPLRRPVRALGPRAACNQRRLCPRRAARQHIDRARAIPARRPTPWSPAANGTATRCRPITWSRRRAKA